MFKILISALLIFGLQACNESSTTTQSNQSQSQKQTQIDTTVITEIDVAVTPTSSLRDSYNISSFSQFILIHNSEAKILIDYDFFPEGYDLCQQATYHAERNPNGCKTDMTLVIPCEFQSLGDNEDDLLSININAPTEETACANNIVLDISTAQVTVEGLVFTSDSAIDIFVNDFEFHLSPLGFFDSSDQSSLGFSSNDVKLEDVYDAIIAKRAD